MLFVAHVDHKDPAFRASVRHKTNLCPPLQTLWSFDFDLSEFHLDASQLDPALDSLVSPAAIHIFRLRNENESRNMAR